MKNTLKRSPSALIPAADNAEQGAAQYGQAIGLKQNDAPSIHDDRVALSDAVDACEQAKTALKSARNVVTSVTSTGRSLLRVTRDVLKKRLGTQHTSAWDVTGFTGSFALPRTSSAVLFRMERMTAYLTANPDAQNEPLEVTSARFQALLTNLSTARGNVNKLVAEDKTKRNERDDATDALYARLRGLIGELNQKLDPLDERWKAFGFNMPGADSVPAVPEGLVVTLTGPTSITAQWPSAARAEHYRLWKKVVGVDDEPVAVGSTKGHELIIQDLPANASVEWTLSAVNNGGESLLSAPVTVLTK